MDFTALKDYLDYLPKAGVPGCDMAVWKDHEPLFRHTAGVRDPEGKQPMQGNETYWFYSCTKVATTCAAMQLIRDGRIHPDDPVAAYLPAYGKLTVKEEDQIRPARRVMTIRHLMSMQSGLDYNLEKESVLEMIRKTQGGASTRELVDAMALEPLCFEPGEDFLYSLSHDVLAAVIEAASGEKFSDYLEKHLFAPLGIEGFGFSLTEEKRKNFCAPYVMGPSGREPLEQDCNNYRLTDNYESGGAGLCGDVDSFITLLDALSCDGRGKNGYEVLNREMLELWSANQLGPRSRNSFDAWKRIGYSYGLGVRTRVNNRIGGGGPVGEFGWDGAAGAWAMIDPENHVSAFFAMHVRNFGYAYDVIHPNLRNLIYQGLKA